MTDTGRIHEPLTPTARRIVFGTVADAAVEEELGLSLEVDRAHLVMLEETGLLSRQLVVKILQLIRQLQTHDYAPLRSRHAPRGLYLLYEGYLIEQLGERAGGALHLGRSRNDLNATIFRLRLRQSYSRLAREALRLMAALLAQARRHREVVMPLYTHAQAALPSTFGHYLLGIATALGRDIQALSDATRDLATCPLGAGAGGGTSVPIDPRRTARLLGFERPAPHSIDAVASRDLGLRLLAAAAILGTSISRLATDLLQWSTAEFGYLEFPDRLVGSSSMMPQKRNAFLLEQVQGRSTAAHGAFMASLTAMHKTPFTNSIAVGTESVSPLWPALEKITETSVLIRLMVAGARPQPERMEERAASSFTSATELANLLVRHRDMAFRTAHHAVGKLIREAVVDGETDLTGPARRAYALEEPEISSLTPQAVVSRTGFGGGPALHAFEEAWTEAREIWTGACKALARRRRDWRKARSNLEESVAKLLPRADSDS